MVDELERPDADPLPAERSPRLSFRSRLTISLFSAAVLPMAGFAIVVLLIGISLGGAVADPNVARILLFVVAIVVTLAVLVSYALAEELTRPLRSIAESVDRVSEGDLSTPIQVAGGDELAALADSHNRLAADLRRRDRELARILASIGEVSLVDDVDALVERTASEAMSAFSLIDAIVVLGDVTAFADEEVVPGVSRPLRAVLRAGGEDLGVLAGRLTATRRWERADQDLFELFASEMAAAIRNAHLFATVQRQNAQLVELDAAKDDFLRGVSHNLQTPLTSIRAYAEQLGEAQPDRRLGIIAEQSERLSRMVRQLLTVTRLESGALKPRSEVVSLPTRVRKAWEGLGTDGVKFDMDDRAPGWLAIADPDQLDQVLWALLDNAIKYGAGTRVWAVVESEGDEAERRLRLTIWDGGPGVSDGDRDRLFDRFARGSRSLPDGGSGLGLYVSRELCRTMGGDLILEPTAPGRGAAFTVVLPGESSDEA